MRMRLPLALSAMALLATACGGGSSPTTSAGAPPATNPDGNPTTAIVTADFDPANGVVPFPNNLLFSGTTDLTLNIPVADASDPSAGPLIALNSLDGWSTVAPWSATVSASIDASTVLPGQSVRFFEVTLNQPGGIVTSVVREMVPGVDYVAVAQGADTDNPTIAIVHLQPLDQLTSYMAVITNGVTDNAGNVLTPSQTYFLAQRDEPLVDGSGNSTDPLLSNAQAQALEPLRQLVFFQEQAAASQGINPDNIALSWVATTQSITPVSMAAQALSMPQASQLAPTGMSTAVIGGAGIADIYIGIVDLPYYLEAPSAENPTAPLTGFWEAAPGAYIPPFDALGLDPTSTNITVYNPFPVEKSVETVPVLVTVPNAGSGWTMPAEGWPVVLFSHGFTRDRTNALALADSMASAGFAVVAIDHPLHGITDTTSPFYVENTPFGPLAQERTFDVDYTNNSTGASGPDGVIDGSGAYYFNLRSLRTARDNFRQSAIDYVNLAVTVPTMDLDGDGSPDFSSDVHFVGQSLGAINGTAFIALEPSVTDATLSAPGGGLAGIGVESPSISPLILAGLEAAGIFQGTPEFDQFVFAAQTVLDPGDPINWAAMAAATNNVLVQEVLGDTVVPNASALFPLTGTEPMAREMGLVSISESTLDPSGIDGITRLTEGSHGSLLDPSASLRATQEMQGEAVSMAASDGTFVQVTHPDILVDE